MSPPRSSRPSGRASPRRAGAPRLLALQTPDGHWGDEQRARVDDHHRRLGAAEDLGADPAGRKSARRSTACASRITWWQLDGRPFFDGETEACINGTHPGGGRLLRRGRSSGWSIGCSASSSRTAAGTARRRGSKRSSFHSTICVLEGLLEYEKARGATAAVTEARARGEEYLLERRMFGRLSSGEVIDRRWTRFSFPPCGTTTCCAGSTICAAPASSRTSASPRRWRWWSSGAHQNGRWPLDGIHRRSAGAWLRHGNRGRRASRWNTLRALRVLDWYGK